MEILRTPTDGCWTFASNAWGRYLVATADPTADAVITDEHLESFEVRDDVPKIPFDLWNRWLNLCFEMTRRDARNLEVSCRFLRSEADPSQYRIVVPEQSVTTASVRVDSFDKAIDIATGEVIAQWPPEGWRPCGSSHSHNTMDAFFSGTDDKYELGDPGLHIVVGNIDPKTGGHTVKTSITANKRRFIIDFLDVVTPYTQVSTDYDPAVLAVIVLPTPGVSTAASYKPVNIGAGSYVSPYAPRPAVDYSALAGEMTTFHEAVDDLLMACDRTGMDRSTLLTKLSYDLEDQAFYDPLGMPTTIEDPFYWSAT